MSSSSTSRKSETDWERVDAMADADIDLTECKEITPAMFAKAVVRRGLKPVPRKAQVTLRLDADIIGWFKDRGRGYQTRINALLRAYVDEQRRHEARTRDADRMASRSG
jgi:uncharacterized protein (DUF4415 family)